jgi:NADP-dependent alcohol dehydrogenase
MNNFELYNPTNLIFGNGQLETLENQIPKDAKILVTYGGGSIKKNGIYDRVKTALKNHNWMEFGGIMPNPEYEYLMNAVEICKKEKIDFLLAIGGGSVIDATKFIAAAVLYTGEEAWEILAEKQRVFNALDFGTILTLPATGSEMNSGAVVTHVAKGEKLGMGGPGLFPKFSVVEPNVIDSLPKKQLQNGIIDSFVHVLEQYATYPIGAVLQDRFSESILKTLIDIAPEVLKQDPDNQSIKANFMWCCTMALNGLIQKGVPTDWGIHAIGHELTTKYHIDHGRTLAIVLPAYYNHLFDMKKDKLAQMAENVFDIKEGSTEEKAKLAIDRIKEFFISLDVEIELSAYSDDTKDLPKELESKFEERKWLAFGDRAAVTPKDVKEIVENLI